MMSSVSLVLAILFNIPLVRFYCTTPGCAFGITNHEKFIKISRFRFLFSSTGFEWENNNKLHISVFLIELMAYFCTIVNVGWLSYVLCYIQKMKMLENIMTIINFVLGFLFIGIMVISIIVSSLLEYFLNKKEINKCEAKYVERKIENFIIKIKFALKNEDKVSAIKLLSKRMLRLLNRYSNTSSYGKELFINQKLREKCFLWASIFQELITRVKIATTDKDWKEISYFVGKYKI